MTRAKWNRLRRRRPELFKNFVNDAWEALPTRTRLNIRRLSVNEVIVKLTEHVLAGEERVS